MHIVIAIDDAQSGKVVLSGFRICVRCFEQLFVQNYQIGNIFFAKIDLFKIQKARDMFSLYLQDLHKTFL